MSNGKNHIADKETLDAVNGKVGSSGDGISGTSLFAKINKLLGAVADHVAEWTSARAANIDNLDAAISGRAPANTALSNAVWTNTRAGYLDKLNSGVAVASLSGKIIKSVQRGIGVGDITISAVNLQKSLLIISGSSAKDEGGKTSPEPAWGRIVNSTTIRLACSNYTSSYPGLVPWQVIEFV